MLNGRAVTSEPSGSGEHPFTVCVFCASSDHGHRRYTEAAIELAHEMAARGMRLVYGGGNNGLMGILSAHLHDAGGQVIGVIPRVLREMGFAYRDADEMIVTDDMRDRKTIMEKYADAFIGMAGGFGTLEEMLEIITLKQIGYHDKPVVFLNTDNFLSGLLDQLEKGYEEHFIDRQYRSLYSVAGSVQEALAYIGAYQNT